MNSAKARAGPWRDRSLVWYSCRFRPLRVDVDWQSSCVERGPAQLSRGERRHQRAASNYRLAIGWDRMGLILPVHQITLILLTLSNRKVIA